MKHLGTKRFLISFVCLGIVSGYGALTNNTILFLSGWLFFSVGRLWLLEDLVDETVGVANG